MTGTDDRPPLVGDGLGIAVLGATGAVGRDLLAVLPKAGLPIGFVRAFARAGSTPSQVELGDRFVPVRPLRDEPLEGGHFEGVDLVFGAVPPDVARRVGPQLAAAGIAYIDIGGALADRAPLVVASQSADALVNFAELRMVSTPSAPALALSCLVHALQPLRPNRLIATINLSAGAAGAAGVDELSRQVIALFNNQDPPRAVFPGGLAFDLTAQVGADDAGWTGPERRIAAEVAALTPVLGERVAVTLVLTPVFTGLAVSAWVGVDELPGRDDLLALLGQAPGLRVGDPVPGVRRVVGQSGLYVGRVRADPCGDGLSIWATADNTRFGATANAVQVARALLERGLI